MTNERIYSRVTETMIHQYIWLCLIQTKDQMKATTYPEAWLLIEWLRQRHSSFLLLYIYIIFIFLFSLLFLLSFISLNIFFFFLYTYLSANPAIHPPLISQSTTLRARSIWYLWNLPIFLKAHWVSFTPIYKRRS